MTPAQVAALACMVFCVVFGGLVAAAMLVMAAGGTVKVIVRWARVRVALWRVQRDRRRARRFRAELHRAFDDAYSPRPEHPPP